MVKRKVNKKQIKKELSDKKVEAILDSNSDKIDHATDLISVNFRTFGWLWSNDKVPPTRDEIQTEIEEMARIAIKGNTEAACGRIQVEYYDDYLQIMLWV